jgi:hypothetical protein
MYRRLPALGGPAMSAGIEGLHACAAIGMRANASIAR